MNLFGGVGCVTSSNWL